MEGLLNILKPPGMTSHDVVAFMHKLTGVRKIGHTGTLDPGAAGVLTLCLGPATRVARFLESADKVYRTEITIGMATLSMDAFSVKTEEADAGTLTREAITALLPKFVGVQQQVPPMTSAVKQGGRKLYELAREGKEVEREARTISIYQIRIIHIDGIGEPRPRILFDVYCSKGTYIRSLCADIGKALGFPAFMSFLVRTKNGVYGLHNTVTLEKAAKYMQEGRMAELLISIEEALSILPSVIVLPSKRRSVRNGTALAQGDVDSWPENDTRFVRLYDQNGFLGVAERRFSNDMPANVLQPIWLRARE